MHARNNSKVFNIYLRSKGGQIQKNQIPIKIKSIYENVVFSAKLILNIFVHSKLFALSQKTSNIRIKNEIQTFHQSLGC